MPASALTNHPLIGLTTYGERARWGPWDRPAAVLQHRYVASVARAGGVPVLLPPVDSDLEPGTPAVGRVELAEMARSAVARLDGLVMSGGADVDPALYGQEPHPEAWPPQPARDAWELALVAAALDRSLPALFICRGLQVLNVHRGGTLHQHVPDVVGHTGHLVALGRFRATEVRVEPGSRLESIVGVGPEVQCCHHQAIDRLGEGLTVVARAPDGVIEAVEADADGEAEGRFLVGVQWHPEEDDHLDLFEALVDAAGRGRLAVGSTA